MTRTTLVRLLVGATLLTTLGGPAVAAPAQPRCHLVVDERGDSGETLVEVPGQAPDPTMDIRSVDVASNSKAITGVLRLDDLSSLEETPVGKRYDVGFAAGEDYYVLTAVLGPQGRRFELVRWGESTDAGPLSGSGGRTIAAVTGVVDVERDQVRITAPLSAFTPYYAIRDGDQLYDLGGSTWSGVDVNDTRSGAGGSVDGAYDEKAVYPVHAPSCVRVGA